MSIRAVIIDDEENNVLNIQSILAKHCPNVEVVGSADSALTAIDLIKEQDPNLVILDIEMPNGNGFDLLESLPSIDFEIIFITAYNQYAIQAIRFSALDYILKPVNILELKKAVEKVEQKIVGDSKHNRLKNFVENIRHSNLGDKKIALPTEDKVVFYPIKDIIYCRGDNNYTHFILQDGTNILVSRTLKEFDELLSEYHFVRIHQSYLINMHHIKTYVRSAGGSVIMENGDELTIARQRKDNFLKRLEELM